MRAALLKELREIKDRLRRHGLCVTYSPSHAPSLDSHIADIKRRDQIERLLER